MGDRLTRLCFFIVLTVFAVTGLGDAAINDPTEIAGNILWLDGNDLDGDGSPDVGSDGFLVEAWIDKSPATTEHHVLRPETDGGNPQQFFDVLDGKSVVRFTDDLAKLDNSVFNVANDYSVFTVVTHPAAGGGRHVLSGMFEDGTDAVLYTNADWRLYTGPGGNDLQISPAATSGTHIFGYQLDSTGLLGGDLGFFGGRDAYVENNTLDWTGSGTLNGIRIGGINRGAAGDPQVGNTEGWLGDIAEVLIYDRPLEGAERSMIVEYLQEKWYTPPPPPDAPAAPTIYTDAVLTDGPLHYYRFEETHIDQPAKDQIGAAPDGDQPGVFNGNITAAQESAYPNLGYAAYFSGDSGSLVDLGTPFHPASGVISIEAWVNLDVDAEETYLPIASRWDGSYELDVNNNPGAGTAGGRLNLVSRNDETNLFGIVGSEDPLVKGQWHHVVGVYQNGVLELWIDGGLNTVADTGEQPTSLQDAAATLFIGSTRDGSAFNWEGFIDEVAFYDYALSSDQILVHVAAAEAGLTCDFDGDGACSVADIDMLVGAIASGDNDLRFDLTGDAMVDQADLDQWRAAGAGANGLASPYLVGDSDLNGTVNAADLNAVGISWLGGVATWSGGDFTADGTVDAQDLNGLALNWQASVPLAAQTVPEPSACILVLLGAALVCRSRRLVSHGKCIVL